MRNFNNCFVLVLSFYNNRIVSLRFNKMQFFSVLQLTYRISARQYTCATSSKIVIGRFSRNKSFFFAIKINIFIALILSGIFLEPVFVELFTGSCSQDRFCMYAPLVCIACFFPTRIRIRNANK